MRKQLKPGEAVNIMAEKVWVTQPRKDQQGLPASENASWSPAEFLMGMLCGIVAAMLRMA